MYTPYSLMNLGVSTLPESIIQKIQAAGGTYRPEEGGGYTVTHPSLSDLQIRDAILSQPELKNMFPGVDLAAEERALTSGQQPSGQYQQLMNQAQTRGNKVNGIDKLANTILPGAIIGLGTAGTLGMLGGGGSAMGSASGTVFPGESVMQGVTYAGNTGWMPSTMPELAAMQAAGDSTIADITASSAAAGLPQGAVVPAAAATSAATAASQLPTTTPTPTNIPTPGSTTVPTGGTTPTPGSPFVDAATKAWIASQWKDFQDKLFSYMEKPPDRQLYRDQMPGAVNQAGNFWANNVQPLFTDPLNAQGSWMNLVKNNIIDSAISSEATQGHRLNGGLQANVAKQTALGLAPTITAAQNSASTGFNSLNEGVKTLAMLGGFNQNYNAAVGSQLTPVQNNIMSNVSGAVGDTYKGVNDVIKAGTDGISTLSNLYTNSGTGGSSTSGGKVDLSGLSIGV